MAFKMAASVWADLGICVNSWILYQFYFVIHHIFMVCESIQTTPRQR